MEFRYGDVVLVHGDDLFSYFVQFLTRSYWTHTMFALENGQFAQMEGFGFEIRRVILNRPFAVLRHQALLNPYSIRAREIIIKMKEVVEQLRTNPPAFDYITIFRLGFRLIRERMMASIAGQKVKPFICSALIDYIYEQAGLDLLPGKDPRDTMPANLAELAFGENPVFKVIHIEKTRNFVRYY